MRGMIGAVLALLLWIPVAAAEELPVLEREALDRFSEELAACASFYLVAAEGSRGREDSVHAKTFTRVANLLLDRAVEISDEATAMAYAKQALRRLYKEMGHDLNNFLLVSADYEARCATAFDHPELRIAHWRLVVRPRP